MFGTLLLPGMVLSRGLGYYGELLISAIFTVAAQLTIGQERKRKHKSVPEMLNTDPHTDTSEKCRGLLYEKEKEVCKE